MTRARDLSRLGNTDILAVDSVNQRVGVGITTPDHPLHVVGVLSATSFVGDGSGLTNTISGVGINSGGTNIGYGVTTLNFVGTGTTVEVSGTTANITPGGAAGSGGSPSTINYEYDSSGTVRTLQDRLEDFVSVTDFGAIGDGNSSRASANVTAFQSAIETGKRVHVPAGDYILDSTLSFSGHNFHLSGDGERQSRIYWRPTATGNGITVNISGEQDPNNPVALTAASNKRQCVLEGLQLIHLGSGSSELGDTCVEINDNLPIGEIFNTVVINNVYIHNQWQKAIEFFQCRQIKANNLTAKLNYGTEILHLRNTCMDCSFENCNIGTGASGTNNITGMLIDGHADTGNEGIRVNNSTFLKTKIGINFNGTAGTYEPHLVVADSHFNCQVNGVIINNVGCAYIHDNLFFSWTGSVSNEIVNSAIIKVTGNRGGEESVIHSNTFSAAGRKSVNSNVQDIGILWDSALTYKPDYDGNNVNGQRPVLIHSNVFTDIDECIKTTANVDFITCINNTFNTNLNGSKQYVTTGNSNITDSTLLTNVNTGAVTQIIRNKGATDRAVELRLQSNSKNLFFKQNSDGGALVHFEDAFQIFTNNPSPVEVMQISANGTGLYRKELQVQDNFYIKGNNGNIWRIIVDNNGNVTAQDAGSPT